MDPVLDAGVEVGLRVRFGGGLLGGVGDRGPAGERAGDAAGQDRRRSHVDEGDAAITVATPSGHADDRPVLGAPVELLEAPPGAVHLRHADLGEQLVGRQGRRQEPLVEVGGGDFPRTSRSLRYVGRAERQGGRREVAGRVGVGDRPADRAAVAHLRITDVARRMSEQGNVLGEHFRDLDVAVPREGADGDVIAILADVREVGEPADVDEHAGLGEAQLHQR